MVGFVCEGHVGVDLKAASALKIDGIACSCGLSKISGFLVGLDNFLAVLPDNNDIQ